MPDLSSVIANIRADGYQFETYVTTPAETAIFRALVNQTTFTYPLQTLTFDTVTIGAFTDILEDQEVVVYSGNTTTVKGRLRVAPGAATSTVLQVSEFSQGRVSVADNDRIEVLRSWRLRDRVVGATSTFPKDSRVAYSDQGANPQPIVCSGGHWVGFVDDGQTFATVQFIGTNSFNVDPDSGSTQTHLWAVQDGTITVGTSTSVSITATFPVGERWISHTVTDSSNSKSDVQYVYVKVYNRTTSRPTDVLIDEMSATPADGWRCNFTVPAGRTTSQLSDGSLVIIWEREVRAGGLNSYGSNATGRSHIKFVGYVLGDSTTRNADEGTVSFEAISPIALLAQLPGFSQVLLSRTSPTNWRGVKSLTTNRAVIYLLRWGTTLLRTCDLVLTANNYTYPAFYVQANEPATQVREIVDGVGGTFTADRSGRVVVQNDLQQMTTTQRTAATTTLTLTDADVITADFDRQHRYQYNTLEGRGFVGASTQKATKPVLSLTPGKAPSEAPQKTAVERLIVDSQSTLNQRTGDLYAKQNVLFNGLPTSKGSLSLRGSYDVFDLYAEWVRLALSSAYSKRGITFSSTRFVIESITIEYDADTMTKTVRLGIQEETDGVDGVTKRPPQTALNNLPAVTLPSIEFPYYTPTTPADNPMYTGRMALIGSNKNVYTTTDWFTPEASGGPTWTSNSISASVSGTMVGFAKDYFSPLFTSGTGAINGWIVTTTNIYYISDIGGARTITNQYTFPSTISQRIIRASRVVNGFAVVASQYLASGGTVITYRDPNTGVWSDRTITTHYNTNTTAVLAGDVTPPPLALGEHTGTTDRVYVGAYTATGNGTAATASLYMVDSYGAGTITNTGRITTKVLPGGDIHIPFHNNAGENIIHWTFNPTLTTLTYARTIGNTQDTSINPYSPSATTVGSTLNAVAGFTRSMDSCPTNRNYLAALMSYVSGASAFVGVFTSTDGGTTWTERFTPATTTRWEALWYDDLDPNTFFLGSSVTSLVVGVTFDQGFTIESRRGNLSGGFDILGIVGY